MNDPTPDADAAASALSRRLAALEDAAFTELHARYFDRLHRLALALARGNETEADDTVQETFVRVARYARAFDTEAARWGWLTVLTRSAARDLGRRAQRRRDLLGRFRAWAEAALAPPSGPVAEDRLPACLEAALAALPADDRRLLEAKYSEGRRTRELAVERGATEKSLEARLARLRVSLRAKILQRLREP